MKKIYKILLISLILLLPVRKAWAFTGTASLVCSPTSVKPGQKVTCTVKGTSDETVNNISAKITLSEGLSVDSITNASGWDGSDHGNPGDYKFNIYGNGVKGNFDIGTINLTVSDTASEGTLRIGLVEVKYWDNNENSNDISNVSADIVVKNQEVSKGLKSLSVEGYNISPIFNSEQTGYMVTIKGDSFKINAVAANDNEKVLIYNEVDRNTPLNANNIKFSPKDGAMAIIIKVGTIEYNLVVTREIEQKYDNTIKSITVGGKNIDLIAGKYDGYEVTLNDVKSYDIKIVLNDEENFYVADAINGVISWQDAGVIRIVIYPKDSSSGIETLTYWITVKKAGGSSTPSSSRPSSTGGGITNPQTGNISIFVITLVLIGSLILSLNLYKKNMNYYN